MSSTNSINVFNIYYFNHFYNHYFTLLILNNFAGLFFSKAKTPSLHMADDTIVITPDHLHVDQVTDIVGAPSAGAISLFVGNLICLTAII